MLFLLKCFFCLAVVWLALQSSAGAPPPGRSDAAVAQDARRHAAAHAQPARRASASEAVASAQALAREGADALAEAARARCLAAPRDCVAAAAKLQDALRAR